MLSYLMPKSIFDTIPSMTANSSVNMNLPIEQGRSTKPKNANLEPPAPVNVIPNFTNLLLVLILSHKVFEIQLREAPESIFATKLCPLLLA